MEDERNKREKEYLAENKIILLYILKKSNRSLENDIYLEMVSKLADINFFEFNELVEELLKEKYIYKDEDNNSYIITPLGEQMLDLSLMFLPGIRKTKIDNEFKKELRKLKEEKSVEVEYNKEKDGSYTIILKIFELGEEYIVLKIKAYSEEEAKNIIKNWKTNTSNILAEILKLLNGQD